MSKISQKFYDKSYFESGVQSKKSCYINYSWMPDLTIPMAYKMIKFLNIKETDKVLDFGCSKGFLVKAFRKLDIKAFGVDISKYAIDNVDLEVKKYCKLMTDKKYTPFGGKFDWVISKDVLEHLTVEQIEKFLKSYKSKCKHMFHVVPLGDDGIFRIKEYHLDKSHLQMNDERWWKNIFNRCGWKVTKFMYHVPGIKDNWLKTHKKGNACFVIKGK